MTLLGQQSGSSGRPSGGLPVSDDAATSSLHLPPPPFTSLHLPVLRCLFRPAIPATQISCDEKCMHQIIGKSVTSRPVESQVSLLIRRLHFLSLRQSSIIITLRSHWPPPPTPHNAIYCYRGLSLPGTMGTKCLRG